MALLKGLECVFVVLYGRLELLDVFRAAFAEGSLRLSVALFPLL